MKAKNCISDADLGRLLDGDVNASQRQLLQEHIESCSDCRARWQRVSRGSQYVDSLLAETATGCLSEEQLAGFVEGTLNKHAKNAAEDHLLRCQRCSEALAAKFTDAYTQQGDKWWSEYVGGQMLSLLQK